MDGQRIAGTLPGDHINRLDGRIKYREDVQEGFENAPRTLRRLFEGANVGKQLLKVAEPE